MDCDIIIPWGKDGNLGAAYNRSMQSVSDWVCFVDHDILQLNPNWYQMILSAIERVGSVAGFITGVTNQIACPWQLCQDAPRNFDIFAHMQFAKRRWEKFADKLELVVPEDDWPLFSGFMIVTRKSVWNAVGGFADGFLGVDNKYHKAIHEAGFKSYVMPGLYMFHIYRHKNRWPDI